VPAPIPPARHADPEFIDTILRADVLEEQEVTYIHLNEAARRCPVMPADFFESLRKHFTNTIIVSARCGYARALQVLNADMPTGRVRGLSSPIPLTRRLGLAAAGRTPISSCGRRPPLH